MKKKRIVHVFNLRRKDLHLYPIYAGVVSILRRFVKLLAFILHRMLHLFCAGAAKDLCLISTG
jgi:hypothetical protein